MKDPSAPSPQQTAASAEHFPAIRGVKWPNIIAIFLTHVIAGYGLLYVSPKTTTVVLATVLYYITTLGELFRRQDFDMRLLAAGEHIGAVFDRANAAETKRRDGFRAAPANNHPPRSDTPIRQPLDPTGRRAACARLAK